MQSGPGCFLGVPSLRCLRQRVKRGWIPSGSEAAGAERKAGFGLQPLLLPPSPPPLRWERGWRSRRTVTPGPTLPARGREKGKEPRKLWTGSCFQANRLCANERGRNAGLEPGRILSKPSCKNKWKEKGKNWCQSISCL